MEVEVLEPLAGAEGVPVFEQVPPAELDGIDLEGLRDHVHLLLVGPGRLVDGKAPVGAGRRRVGAHRFDVDVDVRDGVRAVDAVGTEHHLARADAGIRAGVVPGESLAGDDPALFRHRGAEPDPHGVLGRGDELLVARQVDAHRRTDEARRNGRHRLDGGISLGPEPSPERGHHHPHAVERDAEEKGQLPADDVRCLGGAPHRYPVTACVGQHHVGLEWSGTGRRAVESVLEHVIGRGEGGRGVAPDDAEHVADVALVLSPERDVDEGGVSLGLGWEQPGRSGSRRLVDVEHRRQMVVGDLHEIGRLLGGKRVVGHHQGHRLADVADRVVGQHRLVAHDRPELDLHVATGNELGTREDAHDPRVAKRWVRVDGDQPGMCRGRAHQPAMLHAGQFLVHDEGRPASDPVLRVKEGRDRHLLLSGLQ